MKRSRIDSFIMAQEGLEKLSRGEIEAVQLKKLNRVLALEKERQGFYRNLPERLEKLGELSELPFTDDEDLAQHGAELLDIGFASCIIDGGSALSHRCCHDDIGGTCH